MANFNLTTIRPKGFLHSSAFAEVKDSLAWSLTALGHSVKLTENAFSAGGTNVIFGCELLSPTSPLPSDTIIYNLEQPWHPNMANVRRLARSHRVWDFSRSNVERWTAEGYDARHVPIGYTPNLTRIPSSPTQDIDCLFYGWLTPRRLKIISDLRAAGLNVVATDSAYGGARDNLISRSKLVLNIHHDGRDMTEIVRLSYLLANSKAVVTEAGSDTDEYKLMPVFTCDDSHFVDTCNSVIQSPVTRERLATEGKLWMEKRDYTATVAAALASAQPPAPSPTAASISNLVGGGGPAGLSRIQERYDRGCLSGDMKDFLPWLRSHARGRILEIGTRDGASTSAFLLGLDDAKDSGYLTSIDIDDCSGLWQHTRWTFRQGNSLQTTFPDASFDIVLIDGDHSEAAYTGDLYNAYHWTRPGGLILTHDLVPERGHEFYAVQIRERWEAFASQFNLEHYILPGKYGLGVMVR
jgi:predicted O-methyltransferase YrrM